MHETFILGMNKYCDSLKKIEMEVIQIKNAILVCSNWKMWLAI